MNHKTIWIFHQFICMRHFYVSAKRKNHILCVTIFLIFEKLTHSTPLDFSYVWMIKCKYSNPHNWLIHTPWFSTNMQTTEWDNSNEAKILIFENCNKIQIFIEFRPDSWFSKFIVIDQSRGVYMWHLNYAPLISIGIIVKSGLVNLQSALMH